MILTQTRVRRVILGTGCSLVLFCWNTANAISTDQIICKPSLPYFCANIHVGCAGKSGIETFEFEIQQEASKTSFISSSGTDKSLFVIQQKNGALYRFHGSRSWIAIQLDYRFSFRNYDYGKPLMTYGYCRLDLP